jgi:transcriptional regulator GlxA family with amidase domain
MDGRIFHLTKLLLNDLSNNWTIQEMARSVELSGAHLQKLFKSNLGISPCAYLRELRLERVRELLETTFLQIKQIGHQTGLRNDSHLTREFKLKFGSTPTDYRRNHFEKIQAVGSRVGNESFRQ